MKATIAEPVEREVTIVMSETQARRLRILMGGTPSHEWAALEPVRRGRVSRSELYSLASEAYEALHKIV